MWKNIKKKGEENKPATKKGPDNPPKAEKTSPPKKDTGAKKKGPSLLERAKGTGTYLYNLAAEHPYITGGIGLGGLGLLGLLLYLRHRKKKDKRKNLERLLTEV